jgi:hypothetical protein
MIGETGPAVFTRSGTVAGAVSTFVFTGVHHIFISNIWFSFPFMLVAGVLCGASIAWSYALLSLRFSVRGWLGYNLIYVLVLILLGATSALLFEPVVSMAALMQANGPPDALIAQALPMTFVFTLLAAVAITLLYGRSLKHFGVVLLTTTVLVLLLGLNISALGLVSIPRGSFYLVAEFLALVVLLAAVYAALFVVLVGQRRDTLASRTTRPLNTPNRNRRWS